MTDTQKAIARAISSWFVRRDSKYYCVENPSVKLSYPDVQTVCIDRFREAIDLERCTPDDVRVALQQAKAVGTPPEFRFQTWDGRVVCDPSSDGQLIYERGFASINAWKAPAYRGKRVNAADYGVAGEFFEWIFPREDERNRVLDWVAWNLQNESDKPGWAVLLHSAEKGSGKSTFATVLAELFGRENTAVQNNLDKLTGRFNAGILTSKLVVSEEVKLQQGTAASNSIKAYITETHVMTERKGQEAERVEQKCCFVLTTNHLPTWVEADERRFYMVDVDHDGHASGPRGAEFAELV